MDVVNLACCLAAALLYYNTLDAGFVYDDSRAILTNQDVLPTTPLSKLLVNDFWGTPLTHGGSHGSYRPLCVLSFRINYLLGGFQPWGYHLVNVCLHCLATSLIVKLARTLLPPASNLGVAVTGLLFASHPVHTEAVAGVVGRADLAACVFYIVSFLCYVSHVKHRDKVVATPSRTLSKTFHHLWTKSSSPDGSTTKFQNVKQSYTCEPTPFARRSSGGNPPSEALSVKLTDTWNRHYKYQYHNRANCPQSNGCNKPTNGGSHQNIHECRHRVTYCSHLDVNQRRNKIKDYLISFLNRFRNNGNDLNGSSSSSSSSSSSASSSGASKNSNSNSGLPASGVVTEGDAAVTCASSLGSVLKQWAAMVGCVCFAGCAVFSKETGVTVLGMCAVYDVLIHYGRWRIYGFRDLLRKRRPRRLLLSLMVLCLSLGALLYLRLRQMGSQTPVFATADNPTARCSSIFTRFLTFCYLPVFNFCLLLWPHWLSFDWGMDAIPRVASLSDPRNLVTLVFYYAFYRAVKYSYCTLFRNNQTSQEALLHKGQRIYHKHRRFNGGHQPHYHHQQQQHKRMGVDPHRKNICDRTQCFTSSSSADTLKLTSTCPVCKHNLSNNHHSLLCRNNNNNNNIPATEESGLNQCTCKCVLNKDCASSKKSKGGYSRRWMSPSRNLNNAELVLLSLAFLSIPFLPATNLFFYVGFVVAERVLYIPSVGYCLLVGVGCHVIYTRTNKKLVLLCLILLLVNFSVRTLLRNRDWYDEESLYRSGVYINPPKAYGNLGSVLSSQGRTSEAEWAYRMALKYRGNMADVHYNLGILLQGRDQLEEAIRSYELAIQYRPTLALAHLNLGQLLERLRRCDEAIQVYRRCSRLDGAHLKDPRTHEATKVSALLHLGRLYADQGRLTEAAQAYQEAVNKMPEYYPPQALYGMLEEAILRLQRREQEDKWYRVVLKSSPDYERPPNHPYTDHRLNSTKGLVNAAKKIYLHPNHGSQVQSTVFQHMGRVMFCYYGSWATYRQGEGTFNVADIDATLCSHLVYAFAGVSSEGLIESLDPYNDLSDNWGKGSFNKFSALAKTNPDVKTLLAIGGWNHGSVTFSNMASTETGRKNFAISAVAFLKKYGFQGLDVDWEYPTLRGGAPEDKDNFVLLLSTLKEYLHAEDLLLTVAVAASTQVLEESYNISGIAENTDYISVMTFDYHTASEDSVTGISSPLGPLATDTGENLKKNIKASITAWVDGGAPKNKLLVGFPLYGRTFTLTSSADTEIGAPTSGPGEPGVYTQEAGYLGFYEICTKLITEGDPWTSVYDADSATLYAYNDDQWVTFDDVKTFTTKANYVVEEGLGGAMVWPVETDDFHGICSGIKNPLQKLIKNILKS